jgi:hypothetical protein
LTIQLRQISSFTLCVPLHRQAPELGDIHFLTQALKRQALAPRAAGKKLIGSPRLAGAKPGLFAF